jgi:ketosteroid isomerase-like protein
VPGETELLKRIYAAFNRREIDTVLAVLAPDVDWPNGMEGGRVLGRDAVRQYWTRQFSMIRSQVEPVSFTALEDGRILVDVHQVVHEPYGVLLSDQMVQHIYSIRNGLILSMEIRKTGQSA